MLNQSDFRRLLQTPMQKSGVAAAPNAKPDGNDAASGTETKSGDSTKPKEKRFFKPRFLQKKKSENEPDEDSQDAGNSNYRDRALERRQGLMQEHEQQEQLYQRVDYETSKMLGGDLKHTHLVKGLDFALANKIKASIQNDTEVYVPKEESKAVEVKRFDLYPEPLTTQTPPHVKSQKTMNVYEAILDFDKVVQDLSCEYLGISVDSDAAKLLSQIKIARNPTISQRVLRSLEAMDPKKRNAIPKQKFSIGKTIYEYSAEVDDTKLKDEIPVICIRSDDDIISPAPAIPGFIEPNVLTKISDALKNRSVEKKKVKQAQEKSKKVDMLPKVPIIPPSVSIVDDDDDDIFSGVGNYTSAQAEDKNEVEETKLAGFMAIPQTAGGIIKGAGGTDNLREMIKEDEAKRLSAFATKEKLKKKTVDNDITYMEYYTDGPQYSAVAFEDDKFHDEKNDEDVNYNVEKPTDVAAKQETENFETDLQDLEGDTVVSKRAREDRDIAALKAGDLDVLGGESSYKPLSLTTDKKNMSAADLFDSHERRSNWLASHSGVQDEKKERSRKRSKMDNDLKKINQIIEDRKSGKSSAPEFAKFDPNVGE